MIETWKAKRNTGCKIGAFIMDFSKAFDMLNHDLLITKLQAYGLDCDAVAFLRSYLNNRYQQCNFVDIFSEWERIITRCLKDQSLGHSCSTISLMIFFCVGHSTLCNSPDDNTLYACDKKLESVFFNSLSNWFHNNYMVLNPNNCHFMLLVIKDSTINFNCNQTIIQSSSREKILAVYIDKKLFFKDLLDHLCKLSNQKTNALLRVSGLVNRKQKGLLINSFVKSQFSYCLLICMFCLNTSLKKLTKLC